ncbi:alkane 1-monooxygenase [Albidovulum sp.]|uniref:alkane 1-monooxygenase n=2 Tax=Albidovulum sp. TaxID=1872424 RepID=UPI0039B8ECB3
MSRNGQPEDDNTMRAVLAALDGGQAARPGPEAAGSVPADGGKTVPHLRIVAPGPDAPSPESVPESVADSVLASAPASIPPAPRRPPAPSRDRSRRPGGLEAAAAGPEDPEAEVVAALIEETGGTGETRGADTARAPRIGTRIARGLARESARWRPLGPFLVATLAPVPFLLLAGAFGGIFSLLALLGMTAVLHVLDEVLKRRGVAAPEPRPSAMADRLSVVLASLHFGLLAFAVWMLSGAAGLGPLSWLATLLAFGLWFGQVSNSNAHELIHRTDARLFRLGMWVYISMLYGHHTSAHRLVHHRFVATTDDPSTAAEGEGFWRFVARAWPGAFVAGYEMEEHRRARRHAGGLRGMNPYTVYVAGGAGFIALMLSLFGFDGLLAYLLLCGHAQVQMLLADYVQHYGLLRRNLPSGALEPAGAQHSWDAPHPLSGLMMLNAPRHADHHAHPGRRWPELRLSPEGRAPLLPWSLPVMATIALVPPLWRRVMDPRLAKRRRAA